MITTFGSPSSSSPPASPATVEFVANLVALLADPAAAMERIAQYRDAASELRVAHERLREAQVAFTPAEAKHHETLAAARAEHEAQLHAAQQRFDQDRLQAENALSARAARLTELEDKAAAATQANETLKADLERRLGLLQAAASAA